LLFVRQTTNPRDYFGSHASITPLLGNTLRSWQGKPGWARHDMHDTARLTFSWLVSFLADCCVAGFVGRPSDLLLTANLRVATTARNRRRDSHVQA
jgi:hypothetical protein